MNNHLVRVLILVSVFAVFPVANAQDRVNESTRQSSEEQNQEDLSQSPGTSEEEEEDAEATTPSSRTRGQTVTSPDSQATIDARFNVATVPGKLEFTPKELKVKPGQNIELTFQNNADPSSGHFHNWVLVSRGDVDKVLAYGANAGKDPGGLYFSPDIITSTPRVPPGTATSIAFQAPEEKGLYVFMCTEEGHAQKMKGTLRVEKVK